MCITINNHHIIPPNGQSIFFYYLHTVNGFFVGFIWVALFQIIVLMQPSEVGQSTALHSVFLFV